MLTRLALALCFASFVACGSDDGGSTGGAGGTGSTGSNTGVCVGTGWRDTCFWSMTCSKGRYELFCSDTNDPELDQALETAGITLDGSNCACVVDQERAQAIPLDESFCSSNFDGQDPDRFDKAHVIVNDLCGWTTP